jgi:hypothetical protein
MKKSLIDAIAMTALGGTALSPIAPRQAFAEAADSCAESNQESPLACNAFALTPEQRQRHFDVLGPALVSLKKNVRELDDGYEFEFPGDPATLQILGEWTIQEHLCCPFFDIDLRLDREGGSLWLRLTGRKGVKEFVKLDGAAWIRQ